MPLDDAAAARARGEDAALDAPYAAQAALAARDRPYALAAFPAAPCVAVGYESRGLEVLRCDGAAPEPAWRTADAAGAAEPVDAVAVTADHAVAYAQGARVAVVHLAEGARAGRGFEVAGFVTALAARADDPAVLACGTSAGALHVLDLRERMRRDPRVFRDAHALGPRAAAAVRAVAWTADGRLVSGGAGSADLKFWDVRAAAARPCAVAAAPRPSAGVTSIVCGAHVYALSGAGEVRAYAGDRLVRTFVGPDLRVDAAHAPLALAAGGRLAVGGKRGLYVLDPGASAWQVLPTACEVGCVAGLCDGRVLASDDSYVRVYVAAP